LPTVAIRTEVGGQRAAERQKEQWDEHAPSVQKMATVMFHDASELTLIIAIALPSLKTGSE
jgi:hypothetical protein